MNPRVLIVEDEQALNLLLRYNLESEGFDVDIVERGDDAGLKEVGPELEAADHGVDRPDAGDLRAPEEHGRRSRRTHGNTEGCALMGPFTSIAIFLPSCVTANSRM